MQRPNPGELLHGLRQSLAQHVLPVLPKGVPQQQLKAALHLIGRLERTWDLAGRHLADDNADIAAVLASLLPVSGPDSLESRLDAVPAAAVPGYNDPALQAAAQRNASLHVILAGMPHDQRLARLYERMVARDLAYVGDTKIQENCEQ